MKIRRFWVKEPRHSETNPAKKMQPLSKHASKAPWKSHEKNREGHGRTVEIHARTMEASRKDHESLMEAPWESRQGPWKHGESTMDICIHEQARTAPYARRRNRESP